MSAPVLIQSKTSLPVAEIAVRDRLRPAGEAGVASMMASIREIGQITSPINIRQLRRDGALRYEIIDGAHRLAAAVALGWEEVPVRVFECSDDQARIMEIDSNLAGSELNPLDTAVFLATRKAVYERLHPETSAGVAGAVSRWDATDTMSVASFVGTTAEKFGLSERHVRRLTAAGVHLGPDDVARLRRAKKPVTLADLQVIARIGAPAERVEVVGMLERGAARNAADARRKIRVAAEGAAAPVDPADAVFADLMKRWARAPMAARRRFTEQHWAEMRRIMRDAAAGGFEVAP